MAIKLNRKSQFVPKWKGNNNLPKEEQIGLSYSTLTVEDMFEVQRHTNVNLFAGVPVDTADIESFQKFWGLCRYLVSKYTSAWVNVEVDGEVLLTGEAVTEKLGPAHLELLMEVANEIISRSMGTAEQVKNYESQSEPRNGVSTLTADLASLPSSNERATVEIGI